MGKAARLMRSKAFGAIIATSMLTTALATAQAHGEPAQRDPGHALAEKFSAEADRPAKEAAKREALRRAEEAEMLATAKAEADARRANLEKARAAAELAERQAEERKAAAIVQRAGEAKRLADEKQKAEEARKIADARKAAEEKRVAEQKAAEDVRVRAEAALAAEQNRIAEEKRLAAEARLIAEAHKVAEVQRIAEQQAADEKHIAEAKRAEDKRRQLEAKAEQEKAQAQAQALTQAQAMAAEREAEGLRVSERLRQAHARRDQFNSNTQTATAPKPVEPSSIEPPAGLGGPAPQPADIWATTTTPARSGSTRVTVLLLLEPGNRGIRRHNKTADPLLCNAGGCFVSNGPDATASFLPGRKALGAGRTFGERAGACSQSLGCVFRDVDLGSLPALVQPIDMRVMHHDRREARTIDVPADCRASAGRLLCRRTIQSGDYTMWVVPEDLARAAGAAALEKALAEGLPDSEHAALPGGGRR